MSNTSCNAIPDSPHLDMIITEELIARAESLGACREGVNAAQKLMGQPIRQLPLRYANWSARFCDGMSVRSNGNREWFVNGLRHREDGPAIEFADGRRYWYINGLRHREDGPAVEYADGTRGWYVNGLLHRLDGPAIEEACGARCWYVEGREFLKSDFPRAVKAYLANLATA